MSLKTDDLFLNAVNREHPRQVGRYWASEIYAIRKGYLTPANFFNPEPINLQGARNILTGEAYEAKFKEILEVNKVQFSYGEEVKKEIKITDDVILVVKIDFLMPTWGLETKKPTKPIKEIPEKWKDQLEAEFRAYQLPIYLGIFSDPFSIKYLKYKPSKKRWNNIQEILVKFDKQLREYQKLDKENNRSIMDV